MNASSPCGLGRQTVFQRAYHIHPSCFCEYQMHEPRPVSNRTGMKTTRGREGLDVEQDPEADGFNGCGYGD